jgi:hypothetical protein
MIPKTSITPSKSRFDASLTQMNLNSSKRDQINEQQRYRAVGSKSSKMEQYS